MLKKEVKQYKRGNSFTYRIDLSKKDEFEGGEEIMILRLGEYESIINEIEDLKIQLEDNKKIISKLKENHSEANLSINKIIQEHNDKIDAKNKEIMSLIKENKSDVQKFNEEIRSERLKTDEAKDKAEDALFKERSRNDKVVYSKDQEIKQLNEKLSDSLNMLTAYRLLIERYKSMSFLDRLFNRLPDESDLKQSAAIETYAVLDSSDNENDK